MTCEQHNWEKIEEVILRTWGDRECGKRLLFQCKKCGRLQKIKMTDRPEE